MFIKRFVCEGFGPITRLSIDFPFEADGKPILVALVGQNGAGKSLVLSALLDALVEIKRKAYRTLPEVEKDQLLRMQKKDYIRSGHEYSYIEVNVSEGDAIATLRECVRGIEQTEFARKYPVTSYPHLRLSAPGFTESGFYKDCVAPQQVQNAIQKDIALYFPYFRYEQPAWINPSVKTGLDTHQIIYGESTESMIKTNIIHAIEHWVLDVILDMELYEKQLLDVPIPQVAAMPG